eukprot:UN03963
MNAFLLVALVAAVKASEVALDAPEKFMKNKKFEKISQLVPIEAQSLEEKLNQPAAVFSLSADAEADPALLYNTYGYGVPYAGAYRDYSASAYRPYSYGGYYYGKRSAEAEPEGAADAYYPYAYGVYAPYFAWCWLLND